MPSLGRRLEDFRSEKLEQRLTVKERDDIIREVNTEILQTMMYKLYFDEGLTQREVGKELGVSRAKVQKTFKEMGWVGRHQNRRLDSSEVRDLYEDGLNQAEIAKKLSVSRTYVYKILKETNSDEFESGLSRRKTKIDLEKVRFLYCEKGLTQAEIADLLEVAQTTIGRRVREQKWERHGRKTSIDTIELHRLYFEERMSQRDAAEHLGVPLKLVKDRFLDMGWKVGPRGAILDTREILRLHEEDEKNKAEIAVEVGVSYSRLNQMFEDIESGVHSTLSDYHGSNAYRLEAKRLREEIFGRECTLCEVSQDESMLVIHRKDGTPHNPEQLWNPETLQNLQSNEWARLCPTCHKSVHWSMKFLSMSWDEIERIVYTSTEKLLNLQSAEEVRRNSHFENSIESIRRYRFEIFGDECAICSRHAKEHKLVLHRKDGKAHHRNSTWTIEFLQTAVDNEWVMLCDRCHIGVHWFLKHGKTNWDWIAKILFNVRK